MSWIDEWLGGLVHPASRADPVERSRHERFLVSRTASTLAALLALPPYLLSNSLPTSLEGLAVVALAAPAVALAILSRSGSLACAQVLVSLALTAFAAAAVANFGGVASLAVLALAMVPVDALFSGSRRALVVAAGTAGFAALCLAADPAAPALAGDGLTVVFVVGLALGTGHAAGQAVADRRQAVLLRLARRVGEARESTALEAIDDLVTWHDRSGAVLRANAAAARLVGVPSRLLQGQGLFHRIHVGDRPAYLKAISDAASLTTPVVVQLRVQVGEGTEPPYGREAVLASLAPRPWQRMIWVELRAHRLQGTANEPYAVVAVSRDVSEHRRRAEELEEMRRQAEAASEGRSRLLATASHELRTPLNAIIGYSELMSGKEPPVRPAAWQDYAGMILQSGQHMLRVISTLLDLATIEAGRYDLAPEPVDVADLVREGCRTVELAAERSGVALVRDVAPDLPHLHADRGACRQILLNLLSNAVKFTPEGGQVTVQARRDGGRMILEVRDTGRGVPASELPRLTEPFYRGPSAPSPGDKGTGLGLTIVRELVALHGGRIDLASYPGEGLSATVSLPVEAPCRAEPPPRVHVLPGRGRSPPEPDDPSRRRDGPLATGTG